MNSRQVSSPLTSASRCASTAAATEVKIWLPSTYKKAVGGLCGNYDGSSRNEYMKPDGQLTRSLNAFGDSWRTNERQRAEEQPIRTLPQRVHLHRREVETPPDSGFETSGCTQADLSEPQRPGQRLRVRPVCERTDAALRWRQLRVYAVACPGGGVPLGPWRQQLDCAMSCGPNSVYAPCMSPCPASCADLAAPTDCEVTSCVEGCQCAPGFVMSEGECVPYTQCGCTFLDRYYPLTDVFVTERCDQACQCTATGAVCQAKSCPADQVCAVSDFKRNCFKASPCLDHGCQNGGQCVAQNTSHYTCSCPEGFQGTFCEAEKIDGGGGGGGLETKWIIVIAVLASLAAAALVVGVTVCLCKRSAKHKTTTFEQTTVQMATTSEPYEELTEGAQDLKRTSM
ncbi:unnamed protein product [Gadus morhua 'NCC']